MELVVFILIVSLFGLAAMRWGANSNDGPRSLEWERRHNWRGFSR